jgi:cohesin loading factor subunit SCC2
MSLLNTRYAISAKASFDYQKRLCSGPVRGWFAISGYFRDTKSWPGFRMEPSPTALLQRWYSLAREKRSSRQDFLKALVKVFDVNITLTSSQVRWFILYEERS